MPWCVSCRKSKRIGADSTAKTIGNFVPRIGLFSRTQCVHGGGSRWNESRNLLKYDSRKRTREICVLLRNIAIQTHRIIFDRDTILSPGSWRKSNFLVPLTTIKVSFDCHVMSKVLNDVKRVGNNSRKFVYTDCWRGMVRAKFSTRIFTKFSTILEWSKIKDTFS